MQHVGSELLTVTNKLHRERLLTRDFFSRTNKARTEATEVLPGSWGCLKVLIGVSNKNQHPHSVLTCGKFSCQ